MNWADVRVGVRLRETCAATRVQAESWLQCLLIVWDLDAEGILASGRSWHLVRRDELLNIEERYIVQSLSLLQELTSLLGFSTHFRSIHESCRLSSFDEMSYSGNRVIGRDEHATISEANQSHLSDQMVETGLGKETDLSAWLTNTPDTDVFGIVSCRGSNAAVELTSCDMLPLEWFSGLDVRDDILIVRQRDEIVEDCVAAPPSLERREEACTVRDRCNGHVR